MHPELYAQDSLFTLNNPQIAGVLLIALAQSGLAIWATMRFGRGRRWPVRLALAILAFWLFEWLSPQVFYSYYRWIIPGLPAQWVIGMPPGPWAVAEIAAFRGPASLSAHGRGALAWLLIALSLWPRRDAAN